MFLGNYFTISCSAFWGRKKGRKEERKKERIGSLARYQNILFEMARDI